MNPRFSLPVLFLAFCWLASCGGKKKAQDENAGLPPNDTTAIKQTGKNEGNTDTTLPPLQSLIENGLDKWVHSFKNFHIDSFRQTDVREFQEYDYQKTDDLVQFYALYKPSLSFSPDSGQFIDFYSSGITLEKKGKKIIAIGDVDQAVTLCNLKTKSWKSIISFGPSAGIEEALWISPVEFILAGTMQNDEGKDQPFLLLGDTNEKTFRWFESNFTRDDAAKYEASGFSKLKIDEWE